MQRKGNKGNRKRSLTKNMTTPMPYRTAMAARNQEPRDQRSRRRGSSGEALVDRLDRLDTLELAAEDNIRTPQRAAAHKISVTPQLNGFHRNTGESCF